MAAILANAIAQTEAAHVEVQYIQHSEQTLRALASHNTVSGILDTNQNTLNGNAVPECRFATVVYAMELRHRDCKRASGATQHVSLLIIGVRGWFETFTTVVN